MEDLSLDGQRRRTTVIATYFSEYLFEKIADEFYVHPDDRWKPGVYVDKVYDGQFLGEEFVPAVLAGLMCKHTPKFFDQEADLALGCFYRVIHAGDDEVMAEFIKKCADEMIRRIIDDWLDFEDDHCDYFHSTLEGLLQLALEYDVCYLLAPIQEALDMIHVDDCKFDETCHLISVLAPYI